MPLRPSRVRTASALLATAALTTTLLAAALPTAARADDPRPDDDGSGKIADVVQPLVREARSALDRVEAIVEDGARGDLTMALREVANTREALSGEERLAADRLLMRPTAAGGDAYLDYGGVPSEKICTSAICVHYVTSGVNRTSPAWAQTTLDVLTNVHNTYRAAGYRAPKSDSGRGGSNAIDVYLGELGDRPRGLYGYCTSDDPSTSRTNWDRWAYCALDNDYSSDEFPLNSPIDNLRVTAAHEYFHAIQYAYDRYEDGWLLEATAAWAEDELYDNVNDNVQYLPASQMRRPDVPLDTFDASTGFHYGTWSFFRFLTERYPARQGRLPRLVLDVFRKADGARGAPDMYSWQAVSSVLAAKKTTGPKMLASYAAANRRPGAHYDEGRANRYPTAPLAGRATITPRSGVTRSKRMRHLTTATYRLTPRNLAGPAWKLRLDLDLGARRSGPAAIVTTALRNGKFSTQRIWLNKAGNATKRIGFNGRRVKWVEVTLVNGSGRFKCYTSAQSPYSCLGTPLDDRVVNRFRARAVR
jgi:hypothetical protein